MSLVLGTGFRAASVASIGICFTQLLWRKLRSNIMEVGKIEGLFQMRTNVIKLCSPAIVRTMPMLVGIAAVSWLVPIALIYPPGSLTIGIQYRQVPAQFNVSVVPEKKVFFPWQATNHVYEDNYKTGLATIRITNTNKNMCEAPHTAGCVYL